MESVAAVKSAKRALEVVELLDNLQRPATVAEISTLLKYPQSSTSSLLSGLRRLGYLQYSYESRTYSLSLRTALIGMRLRVDNWTMPDIHELVRMVRERTGLTTGVYTKRDVYMQNVYAIRGADLDLIGHQPGRRLPLCKTAAGLTLLSAYSADEIGRIVRRINAETPEEPNLVPADVLDEIRRIREQGYACIVGRMYRRIGSVALRLPFNDLSAPLSLCVGGEAEFIVENRPRLADIMRDSLGAVRQSLTVRSAS